MKKDIAILLPYKEKYTEKDAAAALSLRMASAGSREFVVSHNWEINEALVEERRLFVEAILRSVAVGSPA